MRWVGFGRRIVLNPRRIRTVTQKQRSVTKEPKFVTENSRPSLPPKPWGTTGNSALLFRVFSLQKGGSNGGRHRNSAYSPPADAPPPRGGSSQCCRRALRCRRGAGRCRIYDRPDKPHFVVFGEDRLSFPDLPPPAKQLLRRQSVSPRQARNRVAATLDLGDDPRLVLVAPGPPASRTSAALRSILKAAGARLWYLPPYSPDLNPIEQTFAQIKHWMRAAQKRTVDEISRHLGELIQTIQPDECKNYFANAGYASIKT